MGARSLRWAYEALKNAFGSAFRGRGAAFRMSPCRHDAEAERWMNYMQKAYEKARQHKDSTTSMLKQYEGMALSKPTAVSGRYRPFGSGSLQQSATLCNRIIF